MRPDELDPETRSKIVSDLRALSVSQRAVQAALASIHAKMHDDERSLEESSLQEVSGRSRRPLQGVRHGWRGRIGIAAGLAAAAVLLLIGRDLVRDSRPQIPTVRESSANSIYATAQGERATVTLPDGSIVQLNVASRLEVPADYPNGNRTVHLDGEAVFTVTHRSSAPFLVVAGPSTTRVLGTEFVVRHYATDSTAFIAVKEGRVTVQSKVLTANQEVRVWQHGVSSIMTTTSARFSFANGVLNLEPMPLSRAILELNRWYNVDIRTDDPTLASRQIAGGFVAGAFETLEEILTLTLDCRVVRQGNVITLYPK